MWKKYWHCSLPQVYQIRCFGKWAPLPSPCCWANIQNSRSRLKILGAIRVTSSKFISGSRRGADDIWDLLGLYAASNGSFLTALRDNLSGPSSRVKRSWSLKTGRIGRPETPVINYHSTLRKIPKQHRSHEASSTRRTTSNRRQCAPLFTPLLVTTTGVEPTTFQIPRCKAKN